jgi:DNA-directed RNA polymerase subunit RPC12/RpoP
MKKIDKSFVASTNNVNGFEMPNGVDINCPHCNNKVTFKMNWRSPNVNLVYCKSRCPNCGERPKFVMLNLEKTKKKNILCGDFYIHPSPKSREPIDGIDLEEEFNEGLRRAYDSTLSVYNHAEWNATAVSVRRTLEGITKDLLPEENQRDFLAQQIEALPDHVDLTEPIITLARNLKQGGNIGAHFDLEKETNEPLATSMVDLLDYLIEYLFVLPHKIQELEKRIEEL